MWNRVGLATPIRSVPSCIAALRADPAKEVEHQQPDRDDLDVRYEHEARAVEVLVGGKQRPEDRHSYQSVSGHQPFVKTREVVPMQDGQDKYADEAEVQVV